MKQAEKERIIENLRVEEYLERRKKVIKEEIKKEQERYPEPFKDYSSFLLLSL